MNEGEITIHLAGTATFQYNGCDFTVNYAFDITVDDQTYLPTDFSVCDFDMEIECSYVEISGSVQNPMASSAEDLIVNYQVVDGDSGLIDRKDLLPGIKSGLYDIIQDAKSEASSQAQTGD